MPAVDLVAEAAKLREAMARGAQVAQQARAQEDGGDAGQSSAEAAAQADNVGETGRGGADGAARPDIEVEAGRLQKEKLVRVHRSAPPTMWRWRPSSSSPEG